MRTMPSGGIIHSNSASAAGKHGDGFLNDPRANGSLAYSAFIQDEARGKGSRSYLIFIGVLAGCFLLACIIQGGHKEASFQLQPQQIETSMPQADQPVNPQSVNAQPYQYGTAYGQPDMRMRIDVNR